MTGPEIVAVVSTASTVVVAIGGYVASEIRSRREGNVTLALAQQEHANERELRSGERKYEARKETYRQILSWALVKVQQVELTLPILSGPNTPAPPDNPGEDTFRTMLVEAAEFGSQEVFQRLMDFQDKVRDFEIEAGMRVNAQASGQGSNYRRVQDARVEVRSAFDALRESIRDELAAL